MQRITPKNILSIIKLKSNTKTNLIIFISTVLVVFSIFNLFLFYRHKVQILRSSPILGTQNKAEGKLDYWYGMVSQHPDYISAWIEIARLEYERGNIKAVEYAINSAEAIDPNFEYLTKTKKELRL